MTDITEAPTFKWGGTAINGTDLPTVAGASWTLNDHEFGSAGLDADWNPQQVLDIRRQIGDPHVGLWKGRISILVDVSGVTAANLTRKLTACWEDVANAFSPEDGVKKLEVTREDLSGNNVVRHILAQPASTHTIAFRQGNPGGNWTPGAYPDASTPHIVYPVDLELACPYWIGATLNTLDTGGAAAKLLVQASADSVTINNPGKRWAGAKFVYTKTTDGVTQVTIENQTNGDTLVLDKGSNFADDDHIGWNEDMERVATGDPVDLNNLRIAAAGGRMRIAPGANTLQLTRDTGSGTGEFAVSWPELHHTY